jgi:hypothetical protein
VGNGRTFRVGIKALSCIISRRHCIGENRKLSEGFWFRDGDIETKEIEDSRRSLLQYYNSQTMTHIGYLVVLIIGSLTLISRWDSFSNGFPIWDLFLLILSIIAGLTVQITGRTLFYGNLAYEIMNAPLRGEGTPMRRLQTGCLGAMSEKRWLDFFRGTGLRSIALVAIVSFALFSTLELLTLRYPVPQSIFLVP